MQAHSLTRAPELNDAMTSEGQITGRDHLTGQAITLHWRNGRISGRTALEHAAANLPWLAPALVDLQINGYGGVDFQRDGLAAEDLLRAARRLRADGCARFLLTLITDDWPRLTARLRNLRELRAQSAELQAAIAGWHIEGPFLSEKPGFHGAHDPALMRDPTPAHLRELRDLTGTDPLLLTLAPERTGAVEAIALAVSLGIKISLGHTDAPVEILHTAVQAGATGFTHLGNGIPQQLDRHDNILWRVFETHGLMVSLIPDRIHLSPALFRAVNRVLKPAAVYCTTDAMAAAGAPPGRYSIGAMQLEVGEDQIVRLPGKPNFAGSALRPLQGVRRAAEMLQRPWQEVWRHFAENPARLMGLDTDLIVGNEASFCLITECAGEIADGRVCSAGTWWS